MRSSGSVGSLPNTLRSASPLTARTLPSNAPRALWLMIWIESTDATPRATPATDSANSRRPER